MDKENKKIITFGLTHDCNYNCSYCNKKNIWDIEEKRNKQKTKDETINKFIKFITNLNEKVIVRLTGDGEIFTHKRILEIIESILKSEHDLILSTNFSSQAEMYEEVVKLNNKSKIDIFISIHPNEINSDKFYTELEHFDTIVKNSPYTDYHLLALENDCTKNLNDKIKENLNKEINFLNLFINEKPVYYFEARNFFIDNFILKQMGIEALQCKNKCMAGKISCETDEYGNIFRCGREAKKGYMYRLNHIGNIKKLKLLKDSLPCFCTSCFHKQTQEPIKMTSENLYYLQKYIVLEDFGKLQNKIRKLLINIKRKIFGNRILFNHNKNL